MCFSCCDADKKAEAMKNNECDGNHRPFITFTQLKQDIKSEYFRLKESGIKKESFRILGQAIIDPPTQDYTLAVTHSLQGIPLPDKESVRISIV